MNKIDLFDGGYLYYDKGKFDKWCVYEVNSKGIKRAPKDMDYFTDLYEYSKIFDNEEIYEDFVKVYDLTTKQFDFKVVEKIKELSIKYGKFNNDIFRIFSTLYMAMISEEQKENTKLGKRIKRLGVYYLLVKLKLPEYCCNFMKGKNAYEISKLCEEGGF